MKEFFNVIANTAAAPAFLEYLIKQAFPEEADTLVAALKGGNKDALILNLIDVIKKLIPQVAPHEQQSLTELITAAQTMVGGPNNAASAGAAGEPSAAQPVDGGQPVG
jgi:hypothetical protein